MQGEVDRHVGSCVGVRAINEIVTDLQNDLVRRGYVTTRVRVPQQDLSTGVLRLKVTPGVLEAFAFERGIHDISWRSAFPTRPGRLLNLRDLEQGLEQMKRVPSQDVEMHIAPGRSAGDSIVALDIKEKKRWAVAGDLNNGGTSPGAPLQGSLTFAWDNPLHLNDILNVSLNGTTAPGSTNNQGNSVYYSVPWGYWTLQASANTSNYSQGVQGLNAAFTLSGSSQGESLSASRMLYRSQRVKTSLALNVAQSNSRSFVDGVEIEVQRLNATYGELALTREANDGRNSVNFTIGVRRGLPVLGATPDVPVSIAPTSFSTMGTFDFSAAVPIGKRTRVRWLPRLRGQITNDKLYTSSQFLIGGRYTVRGFDGTQSLIAESGFFARNEFEFGLKRPGQAVYCSVDQGNVWGPSAAFLTGTSLTGAVVGVRGAGAHAGKNLESQFASLLDRLKALPELVRQYQALDRSASEEELKSMRHRQAELGREVNSLEAEIQKVRDLFAKGKVDEDEVQPWFRRLREKQRSMEEERGRLGRDLADAEAIEVKRTNVSALIAEASALWDSAAHEDRGLLSRSVAIAIGGLVVSDKGTLRVGQVANPKRFMKLKNAA